MPAKPPIEEDESVVAVLFPNNEKAWLESFLNQKFSEQEIRLRDLLRGSGFRPPSVEPWNSPRAQSGPEVEADFAVSPWADAGAKSDMETAADDVPATDAPKVAPSEEESAPQSTSPKKSTNLRAIIQEEAPQEKSRLVTLVKGPLDGIMAVVIELNLSLMAAGTQDVGHQADVILLGGDPGPPSIPITTLDIMEWVFFFVYFAELCLRIFVLRSAWVYQATSGIMYMNLFDAVLVIIHGADIMLLAGASGEQASSIRTFKLLRLVRTARIIKTVAVFRELRLLVSSMLASLGTLFWSIVLLLVVKVGFALMISQALQDFVLDEGQDLDTRKLINSFYGSFLKALFTMFEVTYSGGWPSKFRPVVDFVNPWYSLLLLSYVTLVVFALLRIVTAIFLKETLANAANDAELQIDESKRTSQMYQSKLKDVFHTMDGDDSGSVSYQEFIEHLDHPIIKRYMALLDIHVHDVRNLFDILDDGDGKITVQEFCSGVMNVRGSARALDIMVLQRSSAKVLRTCQGIDERLKRLEHVEQSAASAVWNIGL